MLKFIYAFLAFGLLAGSAQAALLGELVSPFRDDCIHHVRQEKGYADMQGGWKKHLKDLQYLSAIRRCIRQAETAADRADEAGTRR